MLANVRSFTVALAVALLIGCQEAPDPSEPVLTNESVQSSASGQVMWQDNKLQYQVDGNNYRVEVDKPLATQAKFYKNGTLQYRVAIRRDGERIASVRVTSASGTRWFEGVRSGNLTNTSADGGGAGNPCWPDGCPESPSPTGATNDDDCDGSRNAFIGAGIAAIGGGLASFTSGLIGGLFPASAPVTGPAAVASADFAFTAASGALVAFSVYVTCVGGECTTDCVPRSKGTMSGEIAFGSGASGATNTCNA